MKWVMAIIVVAFLLSTFLMYEGRSTRRTPGRNPDGSMSDYEVAQINGRSLMRSELERRLRDYLSTYSSRNVESLDMAAIYQTVLDQAVLDSQLAKEVDEKGIRVSDADADRAMKDYADRYYPTRETFYQALANSGVKVDDYKKSLARQMAIEQLIHGEIGEVVVSEDQALSFYETMKNLIYSKPEGYNIHMADFRTSADAEYMHTKLAGGEKWADIVSNDELASRDVINVTRAPVFIPASAFATGALSVLASLDVGTPSEVFSVGSSDFAVALKTEHVEASVSPYDEVSGDIRNLLSQQEERRRLSEYQTALRNKAQVVINDQELFARPVVSADKVPAVEDVIPELAESPVSAEPESAVTEEAKPEEAKTPATEEVKPVETETPATEEAKPAEAETPATEETANPATEEVKPAEAEETPSTEETKPAEAETPVTEEAKPAEAEAPVVEEAKPAEAETPATEEVKPAETEETPSTEEPKPAETEAPVVEEAKPAEAEIPATVEEAKTEITLTTTSQDTQQ